MSTHAATAAEPLSILIVGPHPDDQEIGMGAAIARLAAQGHDLLLLDVTDGEPTPRGDPETRAREAQEAARILGVRRPRRCLGLPNRAVQHTLEARHAVAAVIREHRASIVFCPHPEDAHPDHRAVTRIVEDARFDAKLTKTTIPGDPIYPRWLFYYYCSHLRAPFDPSFCIDATGYEETKRRAVLAYRSQFVDNPAAAHVPGWLDAALVYFGSRIGAAAAEPFFTREPLAFDGLHAIR
jgi:bacillithiol biosynthesis deacetylase BshB1